MKRYQRKVNRSIKRFNKSLAKDISPYNQYTIEQIKRIGDREHYEALWLIHVYKGSTFIASKLLDYYDIVGIGVKAGMGNGFFWFVNNEIVRSKNI